ncbi:MAG: FRG domain-containing protein, partial [Blastocatellia bacterium]
MKTAFATYHELMEELAKLPKPAPGFVRVYRGQTKDFGVMLPTGLRAGAPVRDPIWRYCAMVVGRELSAESGATHDDDSVWVEAIAQHYGPGSTLLDVTRSIDIALWFALHDRRPVSAEHLVGPPGQPDEARDIPLKETWREYQPSTANGYLYVFDVPDWKGSGVPSHGSLLDLSSRQVLSKSTRIRAQSACLVAGDSSMKGGDLRDFYVCEPISLCWPLDEAPRINDSMDVLFPDPSEDLWYSFFLSVPLTWMVALD